MLPRFRFDALNKTLLVVSLLFSMLLRSVTGYMLAGACTTLFILRTVSKDAYARDRENQRFLDFFRNLRARFSSKRAQRVRPIRPVYAGESQKQSRPQKDRDHKIYKCPQCKQPLRVPKGKGKILITCKSCGNQFEKKT